MPGLGLEPCLTLHKKIVPTVTKDKLLAKYEQFKKDGMPESEAAARVLHDFAIEKHQELHNRLEDLRKVLGEKPADYVPPQSNIDKVPLKKPVTDAGPTKQTYAAKAKVIADKVRKAELPSWLVNPDDTIKKSGVSGESIKNAFADAIEYAGELLDKGVEIKEALEKAANKIIDHILSGLENGEKINPDYEAQVRDGFDKYYRENILEEVPTEADKPPIKDQLVPEPPIELTSPDAPPDLSQPDLTPEEKVSQAQAFLDRLENMRKEKDFRDRIGEKIAKGEKQSILSIRKDAAELLGLDKEELGTGQHDVKLQEHIELAVVEKAREISHGEGTDLEKLDKIIQLYDDQPTIGRRSSQRVEFQQYSTPLPLAFIAGKYVGRIGNILEPEAGNGALTIYFDPKDVHVNEIDPDRIANLQQQGFGKLTTVDTNPETDNRIPGDKVDGLVMNPPFGSAPVKRIGGYKISGKDEQMIISALDNHLKDNGRASIIMGGHNKYDDNGLLTGGDRYFLNYIYENYKVDGVLNIDGKLYNKQGTQFPIRMILIGGRKETPEGLAPLKGDATYQSFDNFKNIFNFVEQQPNDREQTDIQTGVDARQPGSDVVDGGIPPRIEGGNERPTTTTSPRPSGTSGGGGGGRSGTSGPSDTGHPGNRINPPAGDTAGDGGGNNEQPGIHEPSGGIQERPLTTQERVEHEGSGGIIPDSNPVPLPAGPLIGDITKDKTDYRPKSKGKSVETVIPTQMATETERVLSDLEANYGDLDKYVQGKLGYGTQKELFDALSAEQIDGVAMAIHQIDHGGGMIIGDQTGIGKGRIAASIVRYAVKQGHTPVFLTEKPNLFSDFYRDLVSINSQELVPFIVNEKSGKNDPTITDEEGKVVHKPLNKQVKAPFITSGNVPEGTNFILATYSQFRDPRFIDKINFLKSVTEGNILIMDESHNVSGDSNSGELFQELLPTAKGVVYLSATFAKRPENMPVYASRTAMSEALMSPQELVTAIERGGVALQEVVSAALVQSGQMIRRERSFDGVSVDYIVLKDKKDEHRKSANDITAIIRDVIDFQREFVTPIIAERAREWAGQRKKIRARGGQSRAGIDNTPFSSKVFNIVDQLLFSIKAKDAAHQAIAELKDGRKPLIAFKSTMESFLDNMGYKPGDVLTKHDFAEVLNRAISGVMRFTEVDHQGNETHGELTLDEIGTQGRKMHGLITDKISKASTGISISPVDIIRKEISDAGYTYGEITGREMILEYQPDGTAIVKRRGNIDKKKIARDFNSGNGAADVVLINQSGATGISLHASTTFKDQRQRVMISAQLELDINLEVQKRGRIDRTGQVPGPQGRGAYKYMVSAIPSESRLLMMFKQKLKSLDANTTSSQKAQGGEVEVVDFLNKYGDQIVQEYLVENPTLNTRLLDPLKVGDGDIELLSGTTPIPDIASKTSGRVAVLPSDEQEAFYKEISQRFTDHMEYLNSNNANDMEVKSLNLEARTLSKKTIIVGKGGYSPFGQDSVLETVEANVLRKPLKKAEIESEISRTTGDRDPEKYAEENQQDLENYYENHLAKQLNDLEEAHNKRLKIAEERVYHKAEAQNEKAANDPETPKVTQDDIDEKLAEVRNDLDQKRADAIASMRTKLAGTQNQTERYFGYFKPSKTYLVPTTVDIDSNTSYSKGVFIGFDVKAEGGTKNKYAPSNIKLRFAVADGRRIIVIPSSKATFINSIIAQTSFLQTHMRENGLQNWDNQLSNKTRDTRHIVTGNLLQAYGTNQGQLVAYTNAAGELQKGLLLPESYKAEEQKLRFPIGRAADLLRNNGFIASTNREVEITQQRNGKYRIQVPKTTSAGGKYFLDHELRNLIDNENFHQSGNKMEGYFAEDNLQPVLDLLQAKHSLAVETDSQLHYDIPNQDLEDMKNVIRDIQDQYAEQNVSLPLEKIKSLAKKALGEDYNEAEVTDAFNAIGREDNAPIVKEFKDQVSHFVSKALDKASGSVEILKDETAIRAASEARKAGPTTFMHINGVKTPVREVAGGAEVVDGFYSPIEKRIGEFKQENASATKWKDIVGAKEEAKWTGVADWLSQKKPDEQVTKADISDFMKNNRVKIVEKVNTVKEGTGKTAADRMEEIKNEFRGEGYEISVDMAGEIEIMDPNSDPVWDAEELPTALYDLAMEYDDLKQKGEASTGLQFRSHQLSGEKQNEKEVLITFPKTIDKRSPRELLGGDPERITDHKQAENDGHEILPDSKAAIVYPNGTFIQELANGEFDVQIYSQEASFKKLEDAEKYLHDKFAAHEGVSKASDFRSSHFDEPNILAHVRLNTRVNAEGKKVLFLEEVQSDWGEIGRKKGFRDENKLSELKQALPEAQAAYDKLNFKKLKLTEIWETPEGKRLTDIKEQIEKQEQKPQLSPFVTDTNQWTKLALKYALRHAVEEGADKLAWTTGEQQADRYDLSKVVDAIDYKKDKETGNYSFSANKNGVNVIHKDSIKEGDLSKYFGKEVAQKIQAGEGELQNEEFTSDGIEGDLKRLSGNDLKVGGFGMLGFYGDPSKGKEGILGGVAKGLVKELTGKEGKIVDTEIQTTTSVNPADNPILQFRDWVWKKDKNYSYADAKKDIENNSKLYQDFQSDRSTTQHSIEITPELRAAVEGGMPMFHYGKAAVAGAMAMLHPVVEGEKANVQFMATPAGKILGATIGDKIYLNGEHLNPNTLIHEPGHIWADWAEKKAPDIYKRGVELLYTTTGEGSKYLQRARESAFYQGEVKRLGLKGDAARTYYEKEALATAIGDKGAQFISENRRRTFLEWAKQLWTEIGKALGFKDITPEELQDMTFDELTKRAAIDILKGQPEGARPAQTREMDPGMTKMANAIQDARIEGKYGKEALDSILGKLQDTDLKAIFHKVRVKVESGLLDVKAVRERLLTTGQGSEYDQAVLLYDRALLDGRERDLREQIIAAKDNNESVRLQKQFIEVQNESMDNHLANRSFGRTASTIFRLRQLWVNQDKTIVDYQQEFMAAKRLQDLTPEQQQEVQQAYNSNRELREKAKNVKAALDQARAANARLLEENARLEVFKQEAQAIIKKDGAAAKSQTAVAKSKSRVEDAKERLRQLRSPDAPRFAVSGDATATPEDLPPRGTGKFDPKAAEEIGKIAAEKFYQGTLKFDKLVQEVYEDVKDIFPDWTEEDVANHILTERGPDGVLRPSKASAKYFEAQQLLGTSDPELRQQVQAYEDAQKAVALNQFQWMRDRRLDMFKAMPLGVRIADSVLAWQRFVVLSYPSTMVKLAAVVGHQLAFKPFKFLLQKFVAAPFSRAIGIGDKQNIWGDPAWTAIGKYYSAFLRNFALVNLKEHFKGIDTNEVLYGRPMIYDEWGAAKGILNMPGRSHGYIKSFIKNPEFQFAHEQHISFSIGRMKAIRKVLDSQDLTDDMRRELEIEYAKHDVTNEDVVERINKLSLTHASWSILMNDNKLVKKIRGGINNLDPIPKVLIGSELPIIKIPINYVARAFRIKYGLVQAILGTKMIGGDTPSIINIIARGADNVTEKQANLLGQALTLGSFGATLFAIGYMNRKHLKVNDDGSLEFFGQHLSKVVIHSPELESFFSGAESGNRFDAQKKSEKTKMQWITDYVHADADIAAKSPFINMITYGFLPNVGMALGAVALGHKSWGQFQTNVVDQFAKKIVDMTVPGFVKQPAQWMDTKEPGMHPMLQTTPRYPDKKEGFLKKVKDRFKLAIPGMRKDVPIYHPKHKVK